MNKSGLIFRGPLFGVVVLLVLAGCANHAPAPVVERGPSVKPVEVPSKDFHTVKKGETLYGIALDHGQDYRDVATWNNLENPNRILIGQQLRIAPPEAGGSETAVAKPIGASAVESRSLDAVPLAPVSSESVKREPKAGKEAYSEQAWARYQSPSRTPITPSAVAPQAATKPAESPRSEVPTEGPAWAWPAAGKTLAGFNDATNKGVDIAGKAGDPVHAAADGKVVYSGAGLRGYGKLVIIKHDATFLSAYAHNNSILVKEGQSVTRGQKIAEMGNTDADQVKLHFEIRRQGKPVDPSQYLPKR